jgi:hypothetical protein
LSSAGAKRFAARQAAVDVRAERHAFAFNDSERQVYNEAAVELQQCDYPVSDDDGPSWRERCDRAMADDSGTDSDDTW